MKVIFVIEPNDLQFVPSRPGDRRTGRGSLKAKRAPLKEPRRDSETDENGWNPPAAPADGEDLLTFQPIRGLPVRSRRPPPDRSSHSEIACDILADPPALRALSFAVLPQASTIGPLAPPAPRQSPGRSPSGDERDAGLPGEKPAASPSSAAIDRDWIGTEAAVSFGQALVVKALPEKVRTIDRRRAAQTAGRRLPAACPGQAGSSNLVIFSSMVAHGPRPDPGAALFHS